MIQPVAVKDKKKFSTIWILPLIALFIAAWLFVQNERNKGIIVHILMPHAEGVVAGKTEIKVRSVNIGIISDIRLAHDQRSVIAEAKINKSYHKLLTKDANVWMVKPRIDESGVSGLGTLLSGVYIEFLPGTSDVKSDTFKLRTEPPLIEKDIEGSRYTLFSKDAEVLDVGTGVTFKSYQIGQIETATFDLKAQTMRYGIFIKAPYTELITSNVVFWVSSGIDVDLSASGFSFQTESLAKLIKGGVSVAVPEGDDPGYVAKPERVFTLSANYKAAREQRYHNVKTYIINFEQSIRGLYAGAPVEYRGIRVGTVSRSPAKFKRDPKGFITEYTSVPVEVKIEFGRMSDDQSAYREYWDNTVDQWVASGLRATLKTGSLLTGSMYVELDVFPDAKPEKITEKDGIAFFPSVNGGISEISNKVSSLLDKLNNLKLEESLGRLNQTLSSIDSASQSMNTFMADESMQKLPESFIRDFNQIAENMDQFSKTMADYGQGSAIYGQLRQTLGELKRISGQLQPLTKNLNEQPNMMIFDKSISDDVQPQGK